MGKNWIGFATAATISLATASLLVTAAGVSAQQGQAGDAKTGAEVYKNLKMELFRQMPANRVELVMEVMNKVLGVECTHCHMQDQWEREDLNPDQIKARETMAKMFPMVMDISKEHFGGKGGPSCWTCHRGSTKPESRPADGWKPRPAPVPSPFKTGEGTAAEVYENIQQFKAVPANRLEGLMGIMTAALGVDCTHCHVEGDWASDEKEPKRMVRKMFAMRAAIIDKHFPDRKDVLSCWSCHRGSNKPEKNPPM